MKKIVTGIVFILLLMPAVLIFAQEKKTQSTQASAVLEYFEDSSGALRLVEPDGTELYSSDLYFGFEIPVGSTVVTEAADYAELQLDPNGSIIKISENTNFKLEGLQAMDGSGENVFAIAVGKFRAVAARATGSEKYTFKGPSTVAGVRGTDLGMEVLPGSEEIAFVTQGLIDFTDKAGKTIAIGAGQMANALAPTFEPVKIPADMLAKLMKGLDFKKLNPKKVPGHQGAATPPKEEAKNAETPPPAPPAEKKAEEKKAPKAPAKNAFMQGLFDKLKDMLGMEIGSVTIGDTTYAKAVIQPQFTIGKLKMALYLPIIYESNMLDPNDWYHPEGNDEWSFGTDQNGFKAVAGDFINDLFLKIKYVEWGKQRDKFFFKIGNLNDITIGHGLIMKDYANDSDFPVIRRVGLNLGMDFEKIGFEAMVNDIGDPHIFGSRLYFRPIAPAFPMAVGMTVVTDISPASDLPDPSTVGNPIILNGGLDLDFPVIETDPFSIISYADVAGMMPVFRNAVPGTSITSGPARDAMFAEDINGNFALKNWGFAAGLFGRAFILDWRLEYRNFNGAFKPAFYNQLYDRTRGQYVNDIITYLENQNDPAYDVQTMGIYGEAGFTIKKVFSFDGSYFWPWYTDENGDIKMGEDDFLHLKATLEAGVIPVVNVSGSVSYDRTKFMPTLLGSGNPAENLSLFDANTVVTAEIVYPVAPTLDVALLYTTALARDADGNVLYNEITNNPEIATTVSIETRIHF
ncbi:MAG: FecR domain-containing protein [Spirochaetes bacterium]|nr:FecR domain-containing protein [Spirochaetota bacterium]